MCGSSPPPPPLVVPLVLWPWSRGPLCPIVWSRGPLLPCSRCFLGGRWSSFAISGRRVWANAPLFRSETMRGTLAQLEAQGFKVSALPNAVYCVPFQSAQASDGAAQYLTHLLGTPVFSHLPLKRPTDAPFEHKAGIRRKPQGLRLLAVRVGSMAQESPLEGDGVVGTSSPPRVTLLPPPVFSPTAGHRLAPRPTEVTLLPAKRGEPPLAEDAGRSAMNVEAAPSAQIRTGANPGTEAGEGNFNDSRQQGVPSQAMRTNLLLAKRSEPARAAVNENKPSSKHCTGVTQGTTPASGSQSTAPLKGRKPRRRGAKIGECATT